MSGFAFVQVPKSRAELVVVEVAFVAVVWEVPMVVVAAMEGVAVVVEEKLCTGALVCAASH